MQPKTEKDYAKLGFRYKNEQEFNHEFELAKAFFELYPKEAKIRRKLGGAVDWPRALSILHKQRPDLVPDLAKALDSPPKHSYINQIDTKNPSERLVTALGTEISAEGFGRVKNSMDAQGHHVAQKIETSNSVLQVRETEINRDFGLLRGEKMQRKGGGGLLRDKFYTAFPHLGADLFTRTIRKDFSHQDNIKIARKTAWQLHDKLHSANNQSKTRYAHCDIKPENIMVADNGQVTLVDYGLSKKFGEPIELRGTPDYLPTDDSKGLSRNKIVQSNTLTNMATLGLAGTDIAAYKLTFNAIFAHFQTFGLLNTDIQNRLDRRITRLIERKDVDTALSLTMAFIEQEMHLSLGHLTSLSTELQQLVGAVFAELDKLEELSFEQNDKNEILQLVTSLRNETILQHYNNVETLTLDLHHAQNLVRDYQIDKTKLTKVETLKEQLSDIKTNASKESVSSGVTDGSKTPSSVDNDENTKVETLKEQLIDIKTNASQGSVSTGVTERSKTPSSVDNDEKSDNDSQPKSGL